MFESNKSTRIGDILIERGLISRAQLLQALDLQQARHLLSDGELTTTQHNGIGEILIELGFITPEQLKKNLARQNRLRKTTLAFTLVAPLFTMACGGGGGANASTPKPVQNTVSSTIIVPSSSKPAEAVQSSESSSSTAPQSPGSEIASSGSSNNVSSSEIASSSAVPSDGQVTESSVSSDSSSSRSSAPHTSSSSSLQQSSLSSSSIGSSSSTSSTMIEGPVVLYWTVPTRRENGELLDTSEISGYEVRYKLRSKRDFTYIKIASGYTDTYYFDYLKGDYEFQIAAVDINGLYSRFVTINPAL